MKHDVYTKFALDTENPTTNFNLALEYQKQGQTASAISHYLRCAERTNNTLLTYECLLLMYFCFNSQKNRNFTCIHILKYAIMLLPKRPEAYYLLSRHYERRDEWYDCLVLSTLALEVCDFDLPQLKVNVEYPGKFVLVYEKAVSGWYWDKVDESKELLLKLKDSPDIDQQHLTSVLWNLKTFYGIE